MNNNLNLFFANLFDSTNEENSIIAIEVIRLLNLLPEKHQIYFPEIKEAKMVAGRYLVEGGQGTTDSVFKRLTSNSLINKKYLQVFICCALKGSNGGSEAKNPNISAEMFEQYKALILIVAIRQSVNKDVLSRISKMCNEIRQLASGSRNKLVPYLPDISNIDLSRLISELSELNLNLTLKNTEPVIYRQLSALYVPLKAAINEVIGDSRVYGDNKSNKLIKRELEYVDEYQCAVSEINEIDCTPSLDPKLTHEESITSIDKKIYVITEHSKENYAVKQARAKAIHNQIKRRAMYLPCDLNSTTTFEVSSLISSMCQGELKNCEKLILLSLILGKSTDAIRKEEVVLNSDKTILGVLRTHKLPTHKKNTQDNIESILPEVKDTFVMPLPKEVLDNLYNLAFLDVTDEDVQLYLKSVNKKFGTTLNKLKVANFLEQTFISKNQSIAIESVIREVNLEHFPALYYFQACQFKIIDQHCAYLKYLGKHKACDNLFLPQIVSSPSEQLIGSPLKIKFKFLRATIDVLQHRVNEYLRKKKQKFNSKCHNLLTTLTLLVLHLSSGYRPVTGGPGKLFDFNLKRKELWISDKEMQVVDSSRVVILPIICIKVIERYLNYFDKCIKNYAESNPELCQRYKDSMISEKYLFFYIQNNKVVELRPGVLENILEEVLPIPLNWYRHHIYTYLSEENIDHEYINSFMGHSATGGKTFTMMSSCSFREMTCISDCINKLLLQLGVEGDNNA